MSLLLLFEDPSGAPFLGRLIGQTYLEIDDPGYYIESETLGQAIVEE